MFKKIDKIMANIDSGNADINDYEKAIEELGEIKHKYNNFKGFNVDEDIEVDEKYKDTSINEIMEEIGQCENIEKLQKLFIAGMNDIEKKDKKIKKMQTKIMQAIESNEGVKLVDITDKIMEMVNKKIVTTEEEKVTDEDTTTNEDTTE